MILWNPASPRRERSLRMNNEELLIADKEYRRLDLCLSDMTDLSRSRAQSLIEAGLVLVNGRPCRQKDMVRIGDTVRYTVPEAKPIELLPEDIPLDIVYEDDDICVINKPRGMVVHPAVGNETGTLVNALLYHFGDLSSIGGEIRPGIVHRIDKMTSGLLAVAKNDRAHEGLARQFADHSAHRSYIALVAGNVREDTGTVDAPIGRHPTDRKRMAVVENGRRAVTHFRVLYRFNAVTILALELETGRTHQIRVHMAHIHHPVVGDQVYSNGKNALGMEGQALHGWRLQLTHPMKGERMAFVAPLPEDMQRALKRLGYPGEFPLPREESEP